MVSLCFCVAPGGSKGFIASASEKRSRYRRCWSGPVIHQSPLGKDAATYALFVCGRAHISQKLATWVSVSNLLDFSRRRGSRKYVVPPIQGLITEVFV